MTISRFYTPSGRLIQTHYESGVKEDYYTEKHERYRRERTLSIDEIKEQMPDSLAYTTDGGRTVYGGGGILPDYIVYPDSSSDFVKAVIGRSLDNDFARVWLDRHVGFVPEWEGKRQQFIDEFEIGDDMFEDFVAFLAERDVHVVSESSPDLTPVEGETRKHFSREEVREDEKVIRRRIKARIAQRVYDRSAWYPVMNDVDVVLQEALKLWSSAEELAMHSR